jgi:hypothetical protein
MSTAKLTRSLKIGSLEQINLRHILNSLDGAIVHDFTSTRLHTHLNVHIKSFLHTECIINHTS